MTDTNHIWNDGTPIRAKKQRCGCHITTRKFVLCQRGRDLKKAADENYKLWQSEKDKAIDIVIKRSHLANVDIHKKAYLKHLETGKDWVL